MHAEILDRMGCDRHSVMVVHGGGVYGDKPGTIDRWISNYHRLPAPVQRRLVLENCEKSYSVEDCLEISRRVGDLPVVLDTHHYECYDKLHPAVRQPPLEELIPRVLDTWLPRDIKPKMHISNQGDGPTGHHSDYISHIPSCLWSVTRPFDLMIEAKAKEQAVLRLYSQYPQLRLHTSPFVYDYQDLYPYLFPC